MIVINLGIKSRNNVKLSRDDPLPSPSLSSVSFCVFYCYVFLDKQTTILPPLMFLHSPLKLSVLEIFYLEALKYTKC